MPPDLTTTAGVIGAMALIIGVLWRKHEQHDAARDADLAFWRDLAMKGTELADKATTVAARKRDG